MIRHESGGPGEKVVIHVDPDLEDLIPRFIENRKKDSRSICDALKRGDYRTISILGHGMKGAGAGYGFNAVTDIGKAIEDAAKSNNSEEIQKQVGDLLRYLENLDVVFDSG